jgi:arginine deiminase
VLVLGEGAVVVGVGERTSAAGVERLARELFARGDAHEVVAVVLPCERAVMHLDTVVTMLDRDAVSLWPPIARAATFRLRPTRFGVRVDAEDDLLKALARASGVERMRVVETGGGEQAPAEQWHDANNVLRSRPASSSAMTATSRRTRGWPTSASRSSRPPAPSLAAAAAAAPAA